MKKVLNILLTVAIIGFLCLIGFLVVGIFVIQDKYEPTPTRKLTEISKIEIDSSNIAKIFTDTLRTSEFYNQIINWSNNLDETTDFYKAAKFPTKLITIRKLNGNYILYDRCNGSDPRIILTNESIFIYGPLETSEEKIENISVINGVLIITFNNSKSKLHIELSEIEDVYKVTFENHWLDWIKYLTPIDKVKNFDLLVNHCPDKIIEEFDGFDD